MILHDNLVSGEGDQRSPRHGVVARRIGTIALLASSPRPAAGHLDAAAVWLEFRSRTNVRHRSTRLAVSSVHQQYGSQALLSAMQQQYTQNALQQYVFEAQLIGAGGTAGDQPHGGFEAKCGS